MMKIITKLITITILLFSHSSLGNSHLNGRSLPKVIDGEPLYYREVDRSFETQILIYENFQIKVVLDSLIPEISMTNDEYVEYMTETAGLSGSSGVIRWDLDGGLANCHGYALTSVGVPGFNNRMWVQGAFTPMTPLAGQEFKNVLDHLFEEPTDIQVNDFEATNNTLQTFFAEENIDVGKYIIVFWDKAGEVSHTGLPFWDKDQVKIRSKDRQYPVIDTTLQFISSFYSAEKISIYKIK